MSTENDKRDQQNAKEELEGFNAGYLIQKNNPALFKQLQKALDGVDVPFFENFKIGGKDAQKEKLKDQAKKIGKNAPTFDKSKTKDKSKDLDRDER